MNDGAADESQAVKIAMAQIAPMLIDQSVRTFAREAHRRHALLSQRVMIWADPDAACARAAVCHIADQLQLEGMQRHDAAAAALGAVHVLAEDTASAERIIDALNAWATCEGVQRAISHALIAPRVMCAEVEQFTYGEYSVVIACTTIDSYRICAKLLDAVCPHGHAAAQLGGTAVEMNSMREIWERSCDRASEYDDQLLVGRVRLPGTIARCVWIPRGCAIRTWSRQPTFDESVRS